MKNKIKKNYLVISIIIAVLISVGLGVFFTRKARNDNAKDQYYKLEACLKDSPWEISSNAIPYEPLKDYQSQRDCLIQYNNTKDTINFNEKNFEQNLDKFVENSINDINRFNETVKQEKVIEENDVIDEFAEKPQIEQYTDPIGSYSDIESNQQYKEYLEKNINQLNQF